jgi:hypothetical protein
MFFVILSVSEKLCFILNKKQFSFKHHLYKENVLPIFSVLITVALKPPLVDQ